MKIISKDGASYLEIYDVAWSFLDKKVSFQTPFSKEMLDTFTKFLYNADLLTVETGETAKFGDCRVTSVKENIIREDWQTIEEGYKVLHVNLAINSF